MATKKTKSGGIAETIRTIVYAVLIAVCIRSFAYEPFNIPSASMLPTLLVGDYLFVSKFTFGYSRYSLPFGLPLIPGRLFESPPERGDVAVFKLPRDNSTDYIKRVIGLPGDRIQVIHGVLHLNGQAVPRRQVEDYVHHDDYGQNRHDRQYVETLPNGKSYRIIEITDTSETDDTQEFLVPAGHYFMMGDNRDNSTDSRIRPDRGGVGYVPAVNLVGRADFLFFSHNGSARFWEIWNWPFAIRYSRMFSVVQ
jgi:signal peptidase I